MNKFFVPDINYIPKRLGIAVLLIASAVILAGASITLCKDFYDYLIDSHKKWNKCPMSQFIRLVLGIGCGILGIICTITFICNYINFFR